MLYQPKKVILTCGMGEHAKHLASFEMALRDAKIERFNLVSVSSIVPPNAKVLEDRSILETVPAGSVVHCVMSRVESDEKGRLISASVGLAIPKNREQFGYLSEHHSYGITEKECGDFAEDLAVEMLATIQGAKFDINKSFDENEELWKLDGKVVDSSNITKFAIVQANGLWTTCIAVAILL